MFFVLLTLGERSNARRGDAGAQPDRFRLTFRDQLTPETLCVRPGATVVGVHDPKQLGHLTRLLKEERDEAPDLVVVAVKAGAPLGPDASGDETRVVGEWETRVFTTAVAAAETQGRPLALVGLAGERPYGAVLQAAALLKSSRVVFGLSEQGFDWQADQVRDDLQRLPDSFAAMSVEVLPDPTGAPLEIKPDRSTVS